MKLNDLLKQDKEAAELFESLPVDVQKTIRRTGKDIGSLAELRDHTIHMVNHDGPFYHTTVIDGTKLEPEEKAEWTKYHQT